MIKNRKRNLTVLAVLSFVCAAVALNWTYNSRWGKPDAEMVYAEDEAMAAAQTDFARSLTTAGTEYFAEARLTRQVSRDEALELLQTAASSEAASQETIDSAMNAISAMATSS
ncbi:MAG: SpoIIIAH-like family protein, partial [Eubacteriales bacterium]|nr:SpoIIIAH-like family protein [Eubacteriales bacterium]